MKKFFIALGILLLSLILGGGYAYYSIKIKAQNKEYAIHNGSWVVNPSMDLSNRHQRALIAISGLFALRESEVLYFVANKDSGGRELNSKYDYVLEGPAPNARYWSYTLYGHDFFLVKKATSLVL